MGSRLRRSGASKSQAPPAHLECGPLAWCQDGHHRTSSQCRMDVAGAHETSPSITWFRQRYRVPPAADRGATIRLQRALVPPRPGARQCRLLCCRNPHGSVTLPILPVALRRRTTAAASGAPPRSHPERTLSASSPVTTAATWSSSTTAAACAATVRSGTCIADRDVVALIEVAPGRLVDLGGRHGVGSGAPPSRPPGATGWCRRGPMRCASRAPYPHPTGRRRRAGTRPSWSGPRWPSGGSSSSWPNSDCRSSPATTQAAAASPSTCCRVPTTKVVTGHDDGVITLDLAEADDEQRERLRRSWASPTGPCSATSATRSATTTGRCWSRARRPRRLPRPVRRRAGRLRRARAAPLRAPADGATVEERLHQRLRHHAPLRGLGRDVRPLPPHPRHAADRRELRPRRRTVPRPHGTAARGLNPGPRRPPDPTVRQPFLRRRHRALAGADLRPQSDQPVDGA